MRLLLRDIGLGFVFAIALALVVKGMLNKQIAGALGAAEKTIKIHRGRVMGKMDAASVAELVRMTYTVGFAPTLEFIRLPMPSQ